MLIKRDWNFFRQHGFTWYYPLIYSIICLPPGVALLSHFSQGATLTITGTTLLLGPVISMMAGARGEMMRRRDSLETFARGIQLLGEKDREFGALAILKDLVEHNQVFERRVEDAVAAYVRSKYPWPHKTKVNERNMRVADIKNVAVLQAAINVLSEICQRRRSNRKPEEAIDLSNSFLSGCQFKGNWQHADFSGSNFTKIDNCLAADLSGVDLRGANLEQAQLGQANLEGAILSEARLFGVNFHRYRTISHSTVEVESNVAVEGTPKSIKGIKGLKKDDAQFPAHWQELEI